jgi:hypothetical protein
LGRGGNGVAGRAVLLVGIVMTVMGCARAHRDLFPVYDVAGDYHARSVYDARDATTVKQPLSSQSWRFSTRQLRSVCSSVRL